MPLGIVDALKARLGQSNHKASPSDLPQRMELPLAQYPMLKAPLGFKSRWLDDMLSTSFDLHIINFEPPRGFMVPKVTMYDGTSDLFDHLMHFRQLMTLDIGNNVLICKVFSTSLHGPTLSWFYRLSQNSINSFWDVF